MKTKKKFYKSWILTLLVGFFTFSNLFAQDSIPEIKVSKDKVFIEGKLYYIHIVEKGQTLYSICRAYDVEESDVAAENISIMYGPLQVGQALKIPVYKRRSDKDVKRRDKKSDDFLIHKVKPRETLTFLSRKYRVLIDTIVKYNPSTINGSIQINQTILIPKRAVNSLDQTQTSEQHDMVIHHVEAGETLSALQRKYYISIDKIVLANPELVDGLKAGMDLKIPLTLEASELIAQDSTSVLLDSLEMVQQFLDSLGREPVVFHCGGQDWDRFKTFKIALLLPFQVNNPTPDSLITDKSLSKYLSKENLVYYEFYEGFLLAMDSLKNLGMKIELNVFDTEKSLYKTRKIIEKLITLHPDIIIGPVYREMVKEVSEFAKLNEIPIVHPIENPREQPISTINTNPYFFKVEPGFTAGVDMFAKYITDLGKDYKNVVFINSGDSLFIHEINYCKNKLYDNLESEFNNSSASFKEIVIRKDELNRTNHLFTLKPLLEQSLVIDTPNYIIIPSRNNAYVSSMMDILNQMQEYNIQVFGYPEWQRFDNIEQEYFHNLKVNLFTPFYFDLDNKETLEFLGKYQSKFKNIPIKYTRIGYNFTLLGYDVGFYFGNALRTFGNQFPGCLDYYDPDLLLSKYKFKRNDVYSGFYNSSIQIIEFKDDFEISGKNIE